jgi:fructan beta-fructosidase
MVSKADNQYYIDRTQSGNVSFEKGLVKLDVAPRLSGKKGLALELVVDASSVELFADGGLTVMTSIFFPNRPYNKIHVNGDDDFLIRDLSYSSLYSIW